jgi:AraC-like DNA-binding protein
MVTETPAPPAARQPLQLALPSLQLDGAIFFRSEFTESWAYESPPVADQLADALRSGAERLLIFHVVARGSCWVSLADGERHHAEAGDVIVIPYGDPHRMGGHAPAELVPFLSLFDPPPWKTLPLLRHGGGGDRTDVVCGYLHSTDPLFDPKMRALPPLFVVRPPDGPARRWVGSSIDYAMSLAEGGTAPSPTRIPELLLLEILRLHLASAPAAERGWITALRDQALAPALAKLHTEPERRWTVAELASEVAVSRSLLDQRFRDVLGLSPIRYLTGWRMHVAADLLSSTELGVGQVAHRVGYDSEEAFSRAFKRHLGASPKTWRDARRRELTAD